MALARTYTPPADVALLDRVESEQRSNTLTADTEVAVVFRGGPQIVDMYDGIVYHIPRRRDDDHRFEDWRDERGHPLGRYAFPPGVMLDACRLRMTYGLAQHFQSRNIVPTTRDPRPEMRGRASYQLAIEGIDRPEYCRPLTTAQLAKWSANSEGLDRSKFAEASKRDATVIQSDAAIAQVLMAGYDVNDVLDAGSPEEAYAPPETHEGIEQAQRDSAAYAKELRQAGQPADVSQQRMRRGRG